MHDYNMHNRRKCPHMKVFLVPLGAFAHFSLFARKRTYVWCIAPNPYSIFTEGQLPLGQWYRHPCGSAHMHVNPPWTLSEGAGPAPECFLGV